MNNQISSDRRFLKVLRLRVEEAAALWANHFFAAPVKPFTLDSGGLGP